MALILVVLILILLVFGNSIEGTISVNFPEFSKVAELILKIRDMISILVMFVIFLFVYKFSSGKKEHSFKTSILGAAFTSIALYLVSLFFSIYVNIFTNFSVIYGSLATITLILMWLYTIIYVIFLGAEINVITEEWVLRKRHKF